MTRKVTITFEFPEALCQALERQAAREGRPLEELLAEHLARRLHAQPPLTPQEFEERRAAFDRHLGAWSSGDPHSSENDRLDADLAHQYGTEGPRGD